MKVTLRGKAFTILWGIPARGFAHVLGGCESRRCRSPRIFLTEKPPSQACMNTEIHELTHGWFGDRMTEREVRQFGNDMARALWRLGYRKQEGAPR